MKTVELKNIIIHPSAVITMCSTVLFVGMYIWNSDAGMERKIDELQLNQMILFDTLSKIENNDLVHLAEKIEELLNSVHGIEIQLAKIQK